MELISRDPRSLAVVEQDEAAKWHRVSEGLLLPLLLPFLLLLFCRC